MNYQKKEQIIIFLEEVTSGKNKNTNILKMLDLLDIPHPPKEIQKYFHHKEIRYELFLHLINEVQFNLENTPSSKSSKKAISKFPIKYSYTLRNLSPSGIYPNMPLRRGNCRYLIQNQQPIIISKHISNTLWSGDISVINWINREELRFITAVMCAPQQNLIYFSFNDYDCINIDAECFEQVPKNMQHVFIKEYFEMKRRLGYCRPWAGNLILNDSKTYNYRDYSEDVEIFNKLYSAFKTSNQLLLRTCNYFLKGIIHLNNPSSIHTEEAMINVFFCLEGCLHLIQKKYNCLDRNLNMSLLTKIFLEEKGLGEELFDYIKEAYDKRITLAHAEPKWGAQWSPWLTYEDFWDYFKICKHLLNFILINRHIQY